MTCGAVPFEAAAVHQLLPSAHPGVSVPVAVAAVALSIYPSDASPAPAFPVVLYAAVVAVEVAVPIPPVPVVDPPALASSESSIVASRNFEASCLLILFAPVFQFLLPLSLPPIHVLPYPPACCASRCLCLSRAPSVSLCDQEISVFGARDAPVQLVPPERLGSVQALEWIPYRVPLQKLRFGQT